jgi:hypothetical protein
MEMKEWLVRLIFGEPTVAPAPIAQETVQAPRPHLVHP